MRHSVPPVPGFCRLYDLRTRIAAPCRHPAETDRATWIWETRRGLSPSRRQPVAALCADGRGIALCAHIPPSAGML